MICRRVSISPAGSSWSRGMGRPSLIRAAGPGSARLAGPSSAASRPNNRSWLRSSGSPRTASRVSLVVEHHSHRAFADLKRKRCATLRHGSILSRVGASVKPRAVHGPEWRGTSFVCSACNSGQAHAHGAKPARCMLAAQPASIPPSIRPRSAPPRPAFHLELQPYMRWMPNGRGSMPVAALNLLLIRCH